MLMQQSDPFWNVHALFPAPLSFVCKIHFTLSYSGNQSPLLSILNTMHFVSFFPCLFPLLDYGLYKSCVVLLLRFSDYDTVPGRKGDHYWKLWT